MEHDNFLNHMEHIAKADREMLRAELDQASTISSIGDKVQAKPLGKVAIGGHAAAGNCITSEEFGQGVFLKIMLKSLPEATPPPDFVARVMRRITPPPVGVHKIRKKIATVIAVSAIMVGGGIVGIHLLESTKLPLPKEAPSYRHSVVLPDIEQPASSTLSPPVVGNVGVAKKSGIRAVKKQIPINSARQRIPQKGDSTMMPTEGPTPED